MTLDQIEELRSAADRAWERIDFDPLRINELPDADLEALGAHAIASRLLSEFGLLHKAGCDDAARIAMASVRKLSQPDQVALVRQAQTATDPSLREWAALTVDSMAGVDAVNLEMMRRRRLLN